MSIKPLPLYRQLAPTPNNKPQFSLTIKTANGEVLEVGDPKATRALIALMNQHAVIGGAAAHWGGPAAFAEIMSAIHGLMFKDGAQWFERFHFVNDAGHAENGIYALRANYGFDDLTFDELKKFRSLESKLTGHGEAHLNPEGVYISNGPLGSGLGQAQGLAMADKLLAKNRTTICTLSDGGAMEGEARESMAAIAGLAKKGKINPFLLIISDNNTKLSGRIDEDSFDMNPSFEALGTLGWKLLTVEDGHDVQKLFSTFEQALVDLNLNPQQPIAVVCKTIKGFGVKATEESSSGGHGYPLKPYDEKLSHFLDEIYQGKTPQVFQDWAQEILNSKPEEQSGTNHNPSATKRDKVQGGINSAAIKAAEQGLPIVSVTADLAGSTGVAGFQKKYPDRTLDVGVAESNMMSAAIGLSKEGLIPVVDTFAQFAVTKGNLPLIMSGLSCAPLVGLFSHTGFQDAADGASHQATTYFAATASIPQVTLISLSCFQAAEELLLQGLEKIADQKKRHLLPNSQLYFYGRETHPLSFKENVKYEWGKAVTLIEGVDATLVATGPMVEVALEAQQALAEQGISLSVIDLPFINEPDIATISQQLSKTQNRLITLEDHQVVGGMGSILVQALQHLGTHFKVCQLGIKGKFGQSAYKAKQLYDLHDLNTKGILEAYQSIV